MNSARLAHISERVKRTREDPALCATFEIANAVGKWIQYGDDRINAAYPFQQDPSALVRTLGGELESWEANKYVTVVVAEADAAAVARWIDSYFRWVLASGEATVTLRLSRFKRCMQR